MTIPGGASEPTTVIMLSTVTAPVSVSTVWMTTAVTATVTESPPVLPSSTVPSNSVYSTVSAATSSQAEPTLPPWVSRSPNDIPRKGLNTEGWPLTSTTNVMMTATGTTTVWTSVLVPQTAMGSGSATALPDSDGQRSREEQTDSQRSGQLSEPAEHLLIAMGAIGAFVMVAAILWFIHNLRRSPLDSARERKFGRGGSRGWYGWRREERAYGRDEQPYYYGQDYGSDEKSMSKQQHIERQDDMNQSPIGVPMYTNMGRANSQRQEAKPQILLDTSIPFVSRSTHTSPVGQIIGGSATQEFYNITPQNNMLAREPSIAYNNNSGNQKTAGPVLADYNNTGNKNTLLAGNNSFSEPDVNTFDSNQKASNHLSYMSSLSSGFGDGLIMPEPTVNGGASRQTYRQSRNPGVSRFSWSTATPSTPGRKGDRDTIYTTTSEESAPRFRTVNSWVAHQADRSDGRQQSRVPSMPPLPPSLLQATGLGVHYRKPSEDPAFQHHPGDEIEITKGSRVPSAILDTKTRVN
ncbi:hypothetical protein VTL71DRAFT_706 [Oculimacula yallundae]|uniref:Uncharacterized protein n=1 Tax=Oculimacula yallundae TaxID=86028 RepID=A0ABR4D0V6_9HELO